MTLTDHYLQAAPCMLSPSMALCAAGPAPGRRRFRCARAALYLTGHTDVRPTLRLAKWTLANRQTSSDGPLGPPSHVKQNYTRDSD